MKFKSLSFVLVLIFILSISAVGAVDDIDIETDVLETTDDLSLDDVSVEGDLDDGSLLDESLDSSADLGSVDDDLGETNIVDENKNLSMDIFIDDDLSVNNEKIIYKTVRMNNINRYFYNNGSLIGNDNLKFVGGFSQTENFSMFIIDKTIKLDLESAYFVDMGFNLKAPNLEIRDTSFDITPSYLNTSAISINADNITVDNIESICETPYNNDFVFIDVLNSTNVNLSNIVVTYNFFVPIMGNYSLSNYNYIIRLVNSNFSSIKNNTVYAYIPLKSVNYNVFEFPSIFTDLIAVIAAQNSDYMNLSNNNIQVSAVTIRPLTYPTMDTIIIVKSDNCFISNNTISVNDLNANGSNYLYALDMYELSNMTVFNNTISVNTNGGVANINGSGAAYPIQITGPIGSMYIHNNKLTTVNCGPNLGIFSQNYYGDTNLTIFSNIINVTGRATSNYYALVSGMELEDTYAEVYNNTINVVNDLAYSSSNNIYGISYYQTTYNNPHVFKVYNNTILTNGHYAVYLKSSSGTLVYDNSLKTQDLCCDLAVYATSALISGNYCPCINCTCNIESLSSNTNLVSTKNILSSSISDYILNEEGSDIEYTIYVGPNTEVGDGTLENPFNDLLTAFDSVYELEEGENTVVTINIFGGNYSLDSDSIYTNEYINYIIQAMPNENVCIEGSETLYLTSDVKTTDVWTKIYGINFNCPLDFANHMGNVELYNCVINTTQDFYFAQLLSKTATEPSRNFVNCTFIGQSSILSSANSIKQYRSHINISNCKFKNINSIELKGAYVFIENCLFNNVNSIVGGLSGTGLGQYDNDFMFNMSSSIITSSDVVMLACEGNTSNFVIENNWWGSNEIETVANFTHQYYPVGVPSIYAVFNTSYGFLGNNQGEIIGKLSWNDGSVEGIENFNPMDVLLSSESGSFNESNPILKDGIFKVIYTGDALNNEITATLDREVQTLSFNTVGLSVLVDDISYGEYANVTVSAPDNINGSFTVTVNNVSYTVQTAEKSFVVPITELLSVGNYTVDVLLIDDENNIYGSNSTTFKVKNTEEGNTTPVTPTKLATKLSASKVTATYNVAKKLVITLKDVNGKVLANKKVSVKVGSISKTLKTNAKGQVILNVAKLVPKKYTATIKFAGDSAYTASSVKAKVVVKKAKAKITAKAKTFKAKAKVKKVKAVLKTKKGKAIKKAKLKLKVGKKTYTAKTNKKGVATFKVKLTKKGKYTAKVKFAGNKYYKALSKKVKIKIKK